LADKCLKGNGELAYWNEFVRLFFSPKGVFRHILHIADSKSDEPNKQYEIAYPALARYFQTHFDSGVKSMQFIMDRATTDRPLPNDAHWIENSKSSFVYWFEGGSHVSYIW
jgi:hypothetical protein